MAALLTCSVMLTSKLYMFRLLMIEVRQRSRKESQSLTI